MALIALLALALAYFAGVYWGAPAPVRSAARHDTLTRALKAQAGQNAKLRARVAFLEQSLAMATQSGAATKKALFDEQADEVALKKKLAFYQEMLQQGTSGSAVRIAGLQIVPTAGTRRYRFQIVLVRARHAGKHGLVSGTCAVSLLGERAGKSTRLKLDAVSATANPMKFRLRYFQNLAGTFRLPAGFAPRKVEVSVKVGDAASVTSSYSWSIFQG
ncbi:MAG: DUF6776 family protein [Gammaproteobacteria bacterium]